MKKYILYDNKVYEVKINEEDKKNHFADYYYIKTTPYVRLRFTRNELKEYKTADTIEELCDQFVVINDNGKHQVYAPFGLDVWKTDNQVFGATWTKEGLIFVAKRNNEGKLELL